MFAILVILGYILVLYCAVLVACFIGSVAFAIIRSAWSYTDALLTKLGV